MADRTQLYRPLNWSDSSEVALNPRNGLLIKWRWSSLNPEDFSVDEKGTVYHHCPHEISWSDVVRHGEEAANFFEEDDKPLPAKADDTRKRVQSYGGSRYSSSYKGRHKLRKRKYRNIKYRNSKKRQNKKQRRQKKEFKRDIK